jgi:predicted transposase YdaD
MSIFDEIEQEGIEKGTKEGIEKEKRDTIIRSWHSEITIPLIANITGLSISEVEKVIADYQTTKGI